MTEIPPKRLIVLRELAYITDNHPSAAAGDGWLRAFHVRYFRTESPLRLEGMSQDSAGQHLQRLFKDGYVDKKDGALEYRINDKGRQALADNDELKRF